VTTAQLRDLGLSYDMITARVRRGWLRRVHRGVYAVGPADADPLAREGAALLACGPSAVLSHWSAALVWGLVERTEEVHVTVAASGRRTHAGVVVHRTGRPFEPGKVRCRDGLRVTSVRRTIADLAAIASVHELDQVVAEAVARRLVRPGQLVPETGAAGAARLRAVLTGGARLTRSEAERTLLALLDRARLPLPVCNARVAGLEVDAVWPHRRLIVEVDGFATHGHRRAFERDRHRDATLRRAGFDVVRLSWRQLVADREATVALLAQLLAPTRDRTPDDHPPVDVRQADRT
jgi:very-short-patch-repair endonuclease